MKTAGMAGLADALGVTRRQIWAWHDRRARNGFPEHIGVGRTHDKRGVSTCVKLWDVDAVVQWRAAYVPNKGGNPNFVKGRSR